VAVEPSVPVGVVLLSVEEPVLNRFEVTVATKPLASESAVVTRFEPSEDVVTAAVVAAVVGAGVAEPPSSDVPVSVVVGSVDDPEVSVVVVADVSVVDVPVPVVVVVLVTPVAKFALMIDTPKSALDESCLEVKSLVVVFKYGVICLFTTRGK
jgi:hypothetical protein